MRLSRLNTSRSLRFAPLAKTALSAFLLSTLLVPVAGAEIPTFAKGQASPITYESGDTAPASEIWRELARTYDFDVVFSPKLRDTKLSLKMRGASLEEVLDRLALAGSHFWTALDDRTLLVANDTPQARREYEPQAVQTIRLENIRVADAMTALRSIYGLKHITADEERRTMTVRDFASKVRLAEGLLSDLDVPEDEVTIELQLVTLSEDAWRRHRHAASPDSLDAALESGQATRILSTDLGIVGTRRARFDMEEKDPKSGDSLRVGVQLEAQVHPSSQEITLALDSRLAKVTAESDTLSETKETTSAWRIASGETRLIELPGGLANQGEVLALVMTPTIKSAARGGARQAKWISASIPMSMRGAGSEATRAEVKERLRARLAEKDQAEEIASVSAVGAVAGQN